METRGKKDLVSVDMLCQHLKGENGKRTGDFLSNSEIFPFNGIVGNDNTLFINYLLSGTFLLCYGQNQFK